MSYTVKELRESSLELNELYQRSYKRAFIVTSDDDSEFGPKQAYNSMFAAKGVKPGIGYGNQFGESDPFSICVNVAVDPSSENFNAWTVVCSYSPFNPNLVNEDPLQVYPVATYSTAKFEIPIDYDRNGKAVVNSAGDLYDPTVTMDDSRSILTIRRNEKTFNANTAANYCDVINLDSFAGYGPGHAKVNDIRGTPTWNGNIGLFFEVIYEFELTKAEHGWKKKILDAGYREFGLSGYQAIKDDKGNAVTSPALLDGAGQHLAPRPPIGTPVWNYYDVYNQISFGASFNFSNVIGLSS